MEEYAYHLDLVCFYILYILVGVCCINECNAMLQSQNILRCEMKVCFTVPVQKYFM